jgi:hypothetical protein
MNRAPRADASSGAEISVHDPWAGHRERLAAMGAGEFAHVAGTLAAHLANTAALLKRWGNREALCLAGLYHAVYGTDGIRGELTTPGGRSLIVDVIGAESEAIVYRYGACARDAFHPRIGTPRATQFVDRFTESEYSISVAALADFCELTLANELELAISSAAFLTKHGPALADLAERMREHVSSAALCACRDVLRAHAPRRHMDARNDR